MCPGQQPAGGGSPRVRSVSLPDTLDIVVLSPHHVALDRNRGAQMVKNRENERARRDSEAWTTDATPNASTGATRVRKRKRAKTSTATPTQSRLHLYSRARPFTQCLWYHSQPQLKIRLSASSLPRTMDGSHSGTFAVVVP